MRRLLPSLYIGAALLLAADDPGGWTTAKWGMTPDQVLAAVPGSKATKYAIAEDKVATVWVAAMPIGEGGPSWSVYFTFNSGHLARVDLQPAAAAYATVQEFARMESLLAEKYGRPFDRSAGNSTAWPQSRRAAWSLGATSITMVHEDYRPRLPQQYFRITYQPKQSAPL